MSEWVFRRVWFPELLYMVVSTYTNFFRSNHAMLLILADEFTAYFAFRHEVFATSGYALSWWEKELCID